MNSSLVSTVKREELHMKKHFDIKSLFFGLMIGVATLLGIAAANGTPTKPMEYRVVKGTVFEGSFQDNLNKAAADGWKFEESNTFADSHAYAVMSRAKE